MQCVASHRGLAAVQAPRPHRRATRRVGRRVALVVRAHDEADDILPIWSGRLPEHDPAKVLHGPLMGGKTLGEELVLLHDAYDKREHDVDKEMHAHLYSANWQGDVYVGSRWNMLTLLMGLCIATPLAGLLFAWLSYGTLWTGHYYGI